MVCDIPKYPAPETLNVDVSFNARDYTNNGVKFGFLDPFIEDIEPKLISTKGTTMVTLLGYGFVQMEESKQVVSMKSQDTPLMCNEALCSKTYTVKDERTAEISTFEQRNVMKGDRNIEFDYFNFDLMDPDGEYTKNDIKIRYYKDPMFSNVSSTYAYANEDKPIMIATDFFWGQGNNFEEIRKYNNLKCRFTS